MSDLEDRLQSWFAAEVSHAERDLATSRATTARSRRRRPIPGLALVGLLAAIVAVAVAVRPNVGPDAEKGPMRSPSSGVDSPGSPDPPGSRIAFGPDGIPTIFDGETVLTATEAVAHARSVTTDRPFLVGGWYRSWATGFCRYDSGTWTDWRVLLRQDGCSFRSIDSEQRGDADLEAAFAATEAGTALEVVAGDRDWGPLVARVHVHDRRAVDCPERSRAECEAMAVIDAVLWRPHSYANGIPREIDGEPVLLLAEAYGPLTSAGGPQRMLVGGWYSDNPMPCPSQPGAPVSPLVPRCSGAQLSETLEPGGLTIAVVPDRTDIPRGRVVLRVHTGDARASSCPEPDRPYCERAIVVDEVAWRTPHRFVGRYADGIPAKIDQEVVFRVDDLALNEFVGDATFLLGGWHGQDQWRGCGRLGETHPLLDDCSPEWIAEAPGGPGEILMLARDIPEGPVVIRVHTDDPRSGTCPEVERIRCAERLVVDELVWAGDAVTSAEPLRIDDVVMALRQDIASFTVEVDRPSRACDPGWPDVSWVSISATGITNVLVFPTIAAREAVDQNFRSSGWTGLDGCSVDAYGDPWHWVAVNNVMVSTTSDALAERTRGRLEAIAP